MICVAKTTVIRYSDKQRVVILHFFGLSRHSTKKNPVLYIYPTKGTA